MKCGQSEIRQRDNVADDEDDGNDVVWYRKDTVLLIPQSLTMLRRGRVYETNLVPKKTRENLRLSL